MKIKKRTKQKTVTQEGMRRIEANIVFSRQFKVYEDDAISTEYHWHVLKKSYTKREEICVNFRDEEKLREFIKKEGVVVWTRKETV